MISNLKNQLKEAGALDRLPEVYAEIPKVRKELGMPPLVTPTSQIVGAQAVLNVLSGRYKIISNQVKDLVSGLYGKTPIPIEPETQKIVLKGRRGDDTPITGRSADYIPPELEKNREKIGSLAKTQEDLLTYSLYPSTGKEFLKHKYNVE
jgi:pyruvate/oxaloacetate carboxyltransferase